MPSPILCHKTYDIVTITNVQIMCGSIYYLFNCEMSECCGFELLLNYCSGWFSRDRIAGTGACKE